MKTQSNVGCGDLIKATAIILGFLAVLGGIILFICSFLEIGVNAFAGVICILSGWVGSLTMFGFGIIVDAHEKKAVSENVPAESAASALPVQPVFKAEDTEEVSPKNQFGNASHSAPKRVKEGWACAKCSTLNPSHIGSCQSCGEPKPSRFAAPANSSQPPAAVNKAESTSHPAPKKTKDGWACAKCSTINPNHIGSCQSCGEPKPSRTTAPANSSQPPAAAGWRCSRCGTENSKYVGNCVKCGTAKPQT